MLNEIISIIVIMLFSAFFSGMEIAFVSSNRMLAEVNHEQGSITSKIVNHFYAHPNTFVSTMLVGNNIALVIYGILFAKIFDATLFAPLSEASRVTCDTLLSTVVVLFTGEFIPKTLFKANANRLLDLFAFPAYIAYIVLYPISRLCTLISKACLKIAGINLKKEKKTEEFTRLDLDFLVQQSIDNADKNEEIEDEVKIFQNALDFSDTKIRDCMIPRTEIKAVASDCTTDELRQMFIESGHSKIIVYKEDIDNIIGYIHSSELFHDMTNWQ